MIVVTLSEQLLRRAFTVSFVCDTHAMGMQDDLVILLSIKFSQERDVQGGKSRDDTKSGGE